jgi:hypothetical protein
VKRHGHHRQNSSLERDHIPFGTFLDLRLSTCISFLNLGWVESPSNSSNIVLPFVSSPLENLPIRGVSGQM